MRARRDAREHGLARLATAVAKYWVCKRGPAQVNEALECLGGNGYVEECILPRLYREAPLNSIWEGSGNVICLDVLRAMNKEPEAVRSLLERNPFGARRGPAVGRASRPDRNRFEARRDGNRSPPIDGTAGARAPSLAAGPSQHPSRSRRILRNAPGK